MLRLNQALGDGLTQTAHRYALLDALTFGSWCRGSFRWCRRFCCFLGRTVFDRFLNVFFQDAATFAGAFNLGNVQVMLGNHFTCGRSEDFVTDFLVGAIAIAAVCFSGR